MLSVSSERLKSKKRSKKMLSRAGGSKLEVLSGGKRKKKTKKTKRKKRGGEGGEVTVHFGPEKYICQPDPPAEAEGETDTVAELEKKLAVAEGSNEPESGGDAGGDAEGGQDGGGRRKKKKLHKRVKRVKGGEGCGYSHEKLGGGKKKKKVAKKVVKKVVKRTKKGLYKEYLDKKYNKDQLMKKCKKLGIKITTKKKGELKPIKKETLVKKIVALKFK